MIQNRLQRFLYLTFVFISFRFYSSIFDNDAAVKYQYNNTGEDSVQSKIAALSVAVAQTIQKLMIPNDTFTVITPDVQFVSSTRNVVNPKNGLT
jgi:hypothetical protein